MSLEPSDSELAVHAQEGSHAAFSALLGRHRLSVLQLVRRFVADVDDASDVVQETFLASWVALSSYQSGRPFQHWLRQIALNKCRDRARRAAVRSPISGRLDTSNQDMPDSAPGPVKILENYQMVHQLLKDVWRLSPELKEPLTLTAIHGLSHAQAGRILGVSSKAIETRIYRARARLGEFSTVAMDRRRQIN